MRLALAFVMSCLARAALACAPAPTLSHAELVATAPVIVLARAVAATETGVTFERLEALKGTPPPVFDIAGAEERAYGPSDMDGHRALTWWENKMLRAGIWTGCGVSASFEIGRDYLLFPGTAHPYAQAEIAAPEGDLWLAGVRALIADPARPAAMIVTPRDYVALADAAFYGTMTACTGGDGEIRVERVLRGPARETWRWDHPWGFGPCWPGMRYLVLLDLSQEYAVDQVLAFGILDGTVTLTPRRGTIAVQPRRVALADLED